jgi:hypothetical protein
MTTTKAKLTVSNATALVRSTYKALPANPRTLARNHDRAVVDIFPESELSTIPHRRGAIRPRVERISAKVIEDDNGDLYWEGTIHDLDGSEVAFRLRDHCPKDSDYDIYPEACEFCFTRSATP